CTSTPKATWSTSMWAISGASSRRPRSSSCFTPCGESGSGSSPRIGKRSEPVAAADAGGPVRGDHECRAAGRGGSGVRRGRQRRLTAHVSHELRSPLTALRGEMEVALRSERSARDYQRVLHSALEEIDRLTEMSEDLLLITRAEAHVLPAHRVPTDVGAIVNGVVEALQPHIEERELAVDCRIADATRAVVDPELVTRLLQQLLDNAVKFTPPGGRVRVATAPLNGDGGIQIVVEDTGPGLDPEVLPHVFEPFFRADQARRRGTGTGLGLAMVEAIARLHGGSAHAANVVTGGTGARFEVDLPAMAHSCTRSVRPPGKGEGEES